MPHRLYLWIAVLGAALIVLPTWARADQPKGDKTKAEALLHEAAALYRSGDRVAAVDKFEQAYAAYPSPKILYNLGKAYRGIHQPQKAYDTLSRFLREAEHVSPARRREVQGLLDELKETLAARHAGEKPTPPEPASHPPETEPASVTPKVPSPAEVAEQQPKSVPQEVVIVGDRTREDHATPIYKKWWLWAGVGAVVAGTVAVIALSGGETIHDPVMGSLGNCPFGMIDMCQRL
ncbi:MAG TPA: hypothetical protein VFG83_10320 [Kofleriaceae bacterium]|nr:hypothetical protein [Kofleriaceae bacterium]